jgi:DNA invertase Pin-like site-specific DNA recombinase
MKAIAILRVSTAFQTIDEQKEELITFLHNQGYDEIIQLESVGASAIKMDDRYMELINKAKKTIIEDETIKAVGVWEMSRLGRNEMVLMEFKDLFIKNHIQFICKNPFMKLLNDDGSVNTGMELAFSLFATMSKQEMEEKKSRFKRAKKFMSAKGKYLGGKTVKYGYKVVDGFFQVDDAASKVVRTIFDLYSTGKHSSYTLARELQDQGIAMPEFKVCNILKCRAYLGEEVSEYGMHYPQIISKEVFEKCAKVREENKIMMKRVDKICLGSKLIKCPVCGATCTSNSKHYRCSKNAHHGYCENKFALNQEVADELLYRFAFGLHMMWLTNLSEGRLEEYRKELKIVEENIAAVEKKIENSGQKKQRIVDAYLEGLLDKNTRDLRLSKLKDELSIHRDNLDSLESRKMAILGLIEDGSGDTVESFMKAAKTMSSEDRYDVVHKHIEKLVAYREEFGKQDKRAKKPNAVHIIITSVDGETAEYMYIPKAIKGSNLYVLADGEWCPDRLDQAIYAQALD